MGNTLLFSFFILSFANANFPLRSFPPKTQGYHVFINHCGIDTKETIASLLFHNLLNKGLEVFLNKYSMKVGYNIPESIQQAIRKSSVHIPILSVNYAESEYCLDELCLMVETGVPIIPVFWEIQPNEVAMENKYGVCARTLEMHKLAGNINNHTVKKWEQALRRVSDIKGIAFSKGYKFPYRVLITDDMGELVEEIAGCVLEIINKSNLPVRPHCKPAMGNNLFFFPSSFLLFHAIGNANLPLKTQGYHVFINHCGIDTKQTIASLLFHNLENKGLEVFLDKYSIEVGYNIPESIEQAIRKSSVHIAILSVSYADSEYCLNELCLMVETGVPIIPVFWDIQPDEVVMENKYGVYARALQMHRLAGKIKNRTVKKWEEALRLVSDIKGIVFSKGEDMGELVETIAGCVLQLINKKSKKRRSFHAVI